MILFGSELKKVVITRTFTECGRASTVPRVNAAVSDYRYLVNMKASISFSLIKNVRCLLLEKLFR